MSDNNKKLTQEEVDELKARKRKTQKEIRENVIKNGNLTEPRTKAGNTKFPAKDIEEENNVRKDVLKNQILVWKKIIPGLFRRFAKILDPRRPKSVKHKLAVLLMHALLMFVFKFSSRKSINNELAKPQFHQNMMELFPEFDSIPHSDTVGRIMKEIDPNQIESILVSMLKKFISQKKFKQFLIEGNLPISIDGVYKLKRDGKSQEIEWLQRKIKSPDGVIIQQYVAVLEANITLSNGQSIPLLTEFLTYNGNENESKQDCELTGFKRLAAKLKKYFKRQNILLCLDKLYANQNVLSIAENNNWKYIIVLPANKLTVINEQLEESKTSEMSIPGQLSFNGREQLWYWKNKISWNNNSDLSAVSCVEIWYEADQETGEKVEKGSTHKWITNIKINIRNLHEVCNLGARKRWGIEDSNNTEKNRGYSYKHAFSYNWNGMISFHLIMRMAHAINVISEFTEKLKAYIKKYGCGYILAFIKETLWGPWLDKEWFEAQKQHLGYSLQF